MQNLTTETNDKVGKRAGLEFNLMNFRKEQLAENEETSDKKGCWQSHYKGRCDIPYMRQ